MSDLKQFLAQKSGELIKRKEIVLPGYERTVRIRTLSQGAVMRATAEGPAVQNSAIIALCTEDPETGELIFNWGDLADRQIIDGLSTEAATLIANTFAELSGMGETQKELLGKLVPKENFSISSPSVTESPPASLPNE